MFRHTIPIGRILGIPIDLDYSWFLIAGLLTWLLAANYYPAAFKGGTSVEYWLMGAVTAVLFFVSIVVHELAHSLVALRYKIPVHRITLFIFGGVSQIAAEPPSAAVEFLIAIVGPLTSFALAAVFFLLEPLLVNFAPALAVAKYLALINAMLGLFNLDSGISLGWRPRFSRHRLGRGQKLPPRDSDRRQYRPILWLSFYFCGSMASPERKCFQWIVDRLHRLVSGKRSRSSSSAANGARPVGWPQGIRGNGRIVYPRAGRHHIAKVVGPGGSCPRSTVLSGGPRRPHGRTADPPQHEGDSSALMDGDYCDPSHDSP